MYVYVYVYVCVCKFIHIHTHIYTAYAYHWRPMRQQLSHPAQRPPTKLLSPTTQRSERHKGSKPSTKPAENADFYRVFMGMSP